MDDSVGKMKFFLPFYNIFDVPKPPNVFLSWWEYPRIFNYEGKNVLGFQIGKEYDGVSLHGYHVKRVP